MPRAKSSKSVRSTRLRKAVPRASGDARALRVLAELHDVMTSFTDASGKRRSASVASLRGVLAGLGVDAGSARSIKAATKRIKVAKSARLVEPVTVIWEGSRPTVKINAPAGAVECVLELETGETHRWTIPAKARQRIAKVELPGDMPMGYHRLHVAVGSGRRGVTATTRVFAAPVRSYVPEGGTAARHWGLFSPVYALRSSRDLGCGDLTEWRELARWADSLGARVFATLPLLPVFLDEPFDPSPYAPVSRLFWNELFADVTRAPEFATGPAGNGAVTGMLRSGVERREIGELRALPLVDYKRQAALQRGVLDRLSRAFFEARGDQSEAFKRFKEQHPEVEEYAKFRAVGERKQAPWTEWPARLQEGQIRASDYDIAVMRRHLYAQFLTATQLAECAGEMSARGQFPYLDLPVGVSPHGYDVWKNRAVFAEGCSTGAPPDPYFTTGQNWGFPPMHPQRCREDGYAYVIASLRHHMRHSAYLRADHVMALHRLYWIPQGMSPAEGVYVSYNADEMWAMVCIESHRNHCRVIGENLGTVPKAVNDRMERHGVGQLYVVQYELNPDAKVPLRTPAANVAASLNTHDMAQFAHYWVGGDIDDRAKLGMLDQKKVATEHEIRDRARRALARFLAGKKLLPTHVNSTNADAASVTDAALGFLAASDAEVVLVNIEDLWQETHWQNIPATQHEHANWQHKLALDLDAMRTSPHVNTVLRVVDGLRRSGTPMPPPVPKVKKQKIAARVKSRA